MISKLYLSTILFIAALIWGVLLIINGVAVSLTWFRHLSTVSGILLILLLAFDRWLWRWSILEGWFVKRPDIQGTWKATFQSTWVNQNTGKVAEPTEGYMVIRQTFSTLSLRLMTRESASELIVSEITRSADNTYRVAGVYRNEPRFLVRERSPIHNGAILLQVIGKPPTIIKGHYWTDRESAGELKLNDRRKKLFHDFDLAQREFSVKSPIPESELKK